MFAVAFFCASVIIALYCAHWVRKAWRDPDNWYIDPDGKHLAFDRWVELALAILLCLASCIGLLAGFLL